MSVLPTPGIWRLVLFDEYAQIRNQDNEYVFAVEWGCRCAGECDCKATIITNAEFAIKAVNLYRNLTEI